MNSNIAAYWRRLATGTTCSSAERLLLHLLAIPSYLYSIIQLLRAALYKNGLLTTRRLPRPVVSIGNITVGGTGKTPVTAWIASFLIQQGLRVAVLSRGYGGTLEGKCAIVSDGNKTLLTPEQSGDEPYLLATAVNGLAVIIGSDRYAAGLLALDKMKVDIFLLDDGYQHLRLHRDLNILLMDYTAPFGNGLTLPAGLLREPVSAVQRADLTIYTRCPADEKTNVTSANALACRHELADAVSVAGGERVALANFGNRRVLAFAGIAEPEIFFAELRRSGINVVEAVPFADHTRYDESHITIITKAMHDSAAEIIMTTEKDGVKLLNLPKSLASSVFMVRLQLAFSNTTTLETYLLKSLHN